VEPHGSLQADDGVGLHGVLDEPDAVVGLDAV
jgi:hypothetical protein